MNYSNDCPFCIKTRFKNNSLVNLPSESSILFENNNIYVQVDISPLCLGHILIATNRHYLNFFESDFDVKEDTIKIKKKIAKIYKEVYNSDVLFFEHGSAKSGEAGASIDHAHLHVIPYCVDIEEELNRLLGTPIKCDILTNYEFNNEFSYIYLEKSNMNKLIYKVDKLPSQFLRKIISEKLNSNDYLWQDKCLSSDSKKIFNQTIKDLSNKITI